MEQNYCNVTDAEIRELFTAQNERHKEVTAAIEGYNLNGYPTANGQIMSHSELNRLAAKNGMENPDYVNNPKEVFRRSMLEIGWDMCDQWIPYNSLTMEKRDTNTEALVPLQDQKKSSRMVYV